MKFFLRTSLFGLLLTSSLFPWSPPILPFTDLQPTPIIFSLLYLILFVRKIPFICVLPISALVAAIFLMLFFGVNTNSVRGVYSYLLFTVVLISTLDYLKFSNYQLNFWIIYSSILIWFAVSAIQFQNLEFANELIARANSTSLSQGRGTSSLAPEPTFYAIQMLFLSVAILLLNLIKSLRTQDFYILQFLLFFQILLFSRSALIIIVLIMTISIYCLLFKLRYFFLAPLSILYIWYLDIGRLGNFLNRRDSFIGDHSFSDRISQIFYSYYNAIADFFVPHGFNAWQFINYSRFEVMLGFNSIQTNPRILSLTGSIVYELGILGFPLLFFILAFPFYSLRRYSARLRFGVPILLFLLTFNAIPLALPLIAITYAFLVTIYYKDDLENNESIIQK